MTREQIEAWREQVMANRRYGRGVLLLPIQETDALLAAAERALLLESVLRDSKRILSAIRGVQGDAELDSAVVSLRAAICRVERG